jgi:hypothetical protein
MFGLSRSKLRVSCGGMFPSQLCIFSDRIVGLSDAQVCFISCVSVSLVDVFVARKLFFSIM